jgi:hypothetical protein
MKNLKANILFFIRRHLDAKTLFFCFLFALEYATYILYFKKFVMLKHTVAAIIIGTKIFFIHFLRNKFYF